MKMRGGGILDNNSKINKEIFPIYVTFQLDKFMAGYIMRRNYLLVSKNMKDTQVIPAAVRAAEKYTGEFTDGRLRA